MARVAAEVGSTNFWYVFNDQSSYASQDDRNGTIVRFFDYSTFSGPPANDVSGTITLADTYPGDIPDLNNAVIVGGFVQVVLPCSGLTNTTLEIEAAGDIMDVDTSWLDSVGIIELQGTAGDLSWDVGVNSVGPVTSGNEVDFVVGSGDTLTNCMFIIFLDYYLGQ
jgi:hypothetical protein